MTIPELGIIKKGDIRYVHALGGGCMMDMGCYSLSAVRFFASRDPTAVLAAIASVAPPTEPLVDKGMSATLALQGDATANIECHFGQPAAYGVLPRKPAMFVKVACEGGEMQLSNFVLPTLWHSIVVSKRDGVGRTMRTEKVYRPASGKGEVWWTTCVSGVLHVMQMAAELPLLFSDIATNLKRLLTKQEVVPQIIG
jgi:predicted dehydrogenase